MYVKFGYSCFDTLVQHFGQQRALEKSFMIFIYCDINQCHNKALLVQACLKDHTAFVSINQHVSYFF